MRNSKRGGKRLLKKEYFKKEFLCRWISLLLSFCMVASMISGVASFHSLAQEEVTQTESKEEITGTETEEETREEIKARLLRQIKEEGWNPYSADMSLDEFYALMELFMEGTLPLEKEDPVVEIPTTDLDLNGPADEELDTDWAADEGSDSEESDTWESYIKELDTWESKTEEPEIEEPEIEEPDTEMPEAEEPETGEPDIEKPKTEEPKTEEPKTEEPETEEPETEEPEIEEPEIEEPDTEMPEAEEPKIEEPEIEEPDIEMPEAEEPETGEPDIEKPKTEEPKIEGSKIEEAEIGQGITEGCIPRTMFLFGGLTMESTPGVDAEGIEYGSPLPYDNTNGNIVDDDYIPGLDRYNRGYSRPPMGWNGIKTDNDTMDVIVIVPDINKDEPTIAGDVDQDLFLRYDGCYVRRVAAENNDVIVLGVIRLREQNTYVYYYATKEGQEVEVSATTLPEGDKFIIQYSASEHSIEYKVYEVELKGSENETELTEEGIDVTDERIDEIFGTDRPVKTNQGEYSFTAQTPDYYTLSFYLKKRNLDGTWGEPKLQLGTKEERVEWQTKENKEKESDGLYTDVNDGWSLGAEPVYNGESEMSDFSVRPNTNMGPKTLTTNGTFYNPEVKEDRVIIAVLRKKGEPKFSIKPVQFALAGVGGGTSDEYDRGTAATADYDWDADFNYHYYKEIEGKNDDENPYPNPYPNGRPSSVEFPNLGEIENKEWRWGPWQMEMNEDTDGTYSYSWTFQTNDYRKKWYLDGLEVNSVGVTVPFFPKYVWHGYNGQEDAGVEGTESGIKAWYTETTLPDGAIVKVEYLLLFSKTGEDNTAQRHYRISVRNARANVTITGMNLMLYSTGQPEFSVYELDGITGATVKGNAHVESIQYYDRGKGNKDGEAGWSENQYKANVILSYEDGQSDGYGSPLGPSGIDYDKGDPNNSGANIRFKLAEGYDSPYYLYESLRDGTIKGADGKPQASAEREEETGRVKTGEQNPVVPYVSDGNKPWMRSDAGEPIPVTSEGERLYDEDGNLFTDWSRIRIKVEEKVVESDGGTQIVEEQVLFPELYDSGHNPLGIKDVIAPNGKYVFHFEGQGYSLSSQYIYGPDADGWYYIRVTGQGTFDENGTYIHASQSGNPYKIALLTIVAHPVRYVVRYKPVELEEFTIINGDTETTIEARYPENMPEFVHGASCLLFPEGDNNDDNNGEEDDRKVEQFDDNSHKFYDIIDNTTAAVSSLQPMDSDSNGYYKFMDWVLVDQDDNPVLRHVIDSNGNWAIDKGEYIMEEIHFPISGSIDIPDVSEFAFVNYDLGPSDVDIYVLRLMPTWERIEKPFHYTVALNWVDASGKLHEKYFADLWQEILTDYELDGNGMTVKVLTESIPFQNWIARHPTYSFWDSVNNATKDGEIEAALGYYLPEMAEGKAWQEILTALRRRDRDGSEEGADFTRQGNYTFTVNEDRGTLVLWMYEDKGGLVFHKDVDAESFIYNDEFYFTVDNMEVDDYGSKLSGVYKAYPEKVYDEMTGEERERLDKDAWLVQFEDGKITNIVKNDGSAWPEEPVTYFTLHDDEGIMLAVPEGRYTVHELGSKSGGSYMVEVKYKDGDTLPEDNRSLPEITQWVKGRETTYQGTGGTENPTFPDGTSQASTPPMQVRTGEDYMVYTNFSNQTSTIAFEKTVVGPYEDEEFEFEATLILPDGTEPLKDGDYNYFNFNLYNVEYEEDEAAAEKPPEPNKKSPEHEEWHNWRPEGTLSHVTIGRMVVRSTESPDNWVSQYLLIPQSYDEDGIPTGWGKMNSKDGIWLTSSQRLYVVCTVPDGGEEINYFIAETNSNGYKPAGDIPKEGHANAAELAYELFVNTKLSLLPATGGSGVRMFWASGMVFLLSGIGLAWLNCDFRKRRWRFEE